MKKPNSDTERQLLENISNGDSQAFSTLYLHFYNRLFQFALMFLNSEQSAEDVIEDLFFMIWEDRKTISNVSNIQSFLYKSVRNACLNILKSSYVSKRVFNPFTELEVTTTYENPIEELNFKELNNALQETVNRLPEKCKLIFKMAKEDEMNHQEIADILGVKVCTVDRQLLLAKEKIKKALKPYLEEK